MLMKRALLILMSIFLVGCASTQVPSYVKDTNPYKFKLYASYPKSLTATKQALESNGWSIQSVSDPGIFEQEKKKTDPNTQQILLITNTKDIPMFLGTRYARLNVYLTSADVNQTDLEIRYVTINAAMFGSFENHKHPIAVDNLYNDIDKLLK